MRASMAFDARLLRKDVSPRTVRVRVDSDRPPGTLRDITGGGDLLNVDVYALADADGWPNEATYTFVETVRRTRADPDI